jgi:hypothetical protein
MFNIVLDWILGLLATLTQLVIKHNYGAITNFHTLQFSRAHAKPFPACSVFTRRLLATASNSDYSSLNNGSLPTELFLLQLSL